jgi:hypothetical protein
MLPEEDHGELHRLAGETRKAAADIIRLRLRWALSNRDLLQRLPAAGQQPAQAQRSRQARNQPGANSGRRSPRISGQYSPLVGLRRARHLVARGKL